MDEKSFSIEVESPYDVAQTEERIRDAVQNAKWSILGGYKFHEILEGKGFPQKGTFTTLEVCNARHADRLLNEEGKVAMCMPCKIVILGTGDQVRVYAMMPGRALPMMFDQMSPEAYEYAKTIDREIAEIIQAALS